MIILKVTFYLVGLVIFLNLNSNMIILKAKYVVPFFFNPKTFKFQYDNT